MEKVQREPGLGTSPLNNADPTVTDPDTEGAGLRVSDWWHAEVLLCSGQ